VHCQCMKERQAAAALETLLRLTVYLPEVRRRFRGQIQHTPFFPGYLFVRANFQVVDMAKINTIPGVLHLVAFDQVPQSIPTAVIDEIHAHVNELDAQGGLAAHHFRPGDTVRLKAGPLQGLEAAFLGPMIPSERVRVLIDFLGSRRQADVSVDDLESVGAASPPQQARRTRGRGRPIQRH
jgi:transcription antitermination factor NusG